MTKPPAACERCAAPDGAHQPWCLLQSVIDRFLAPPTPAAPAPPTYPDLPLNPAQLIAVIRDAAREAAREAVAEVLEGRRPPAAETAPPVPAEPDRESHLRAVPKIAPDDAPPVAPEPAPEPAPESAPEPAPHKGTGKVPAAEVDRIMDWLAHATETAGPDEYVMSPDLVDAYNASRDVPLHPIVAGRFIGRVLTEVGYAKGHLFLDAPDGSRKRPKRVIYYGLRLRATDATPEGDPRPAWMSSPSEQKRADEDRAGYTGQWPGREIPADFRNKVVVPILRAGKGWEYRKCNGNGAGKPRLVSPDGRTYTLPNTPSDWRGLKNTVSNLRRAGAL